ncbi:MAG TPA: hypothetical protein VGS79_04670 [Puia sp.]|nr:hypothetical protein [Puia sp.]
MKQRPRLSSAAKWTTIGLVTAAIGVAAQIIAGHPYPRVPPVFFILLIPAGLVLFGRWRWTSIIIALAGLFLFQGLFASGAYVRLYTPGNLGDSVGLWIQTIGVIIATIASIIAIIQNYFIRAA